jgi:hypothetical protein
MRLDMTWEGLDQMMKSKVARVSAFVATLGVSAGLVGAAVQTTGAYFSDSKAGSVTGTIGSIKVTGSGGSGADALDLSFSNMLPGERQTVSAAYQNTGANPQDVWLVFNNADALHSLNQLGTFGEVHVGSGGTEIFASQNLNDNTSSCPPGSFDATHPACAALPVKLKLADNLAPTAGGSFSFAFNYAAKLRGAANEGAPFNCYPFGTCTNSGLPYKIVATQHGVDPFDALNTSQP